MQSPLLALAFHPARGLVFETLQSVAIALSWYQKAS